MADLNRVILPGLTHWQSPNFHAYYPTATSFPSVIGEMISAGFGVIGFSWICSPVCTELEVAVMDWLAKMIDLPEIFLHSHNGPGGGVLQGSASESVLVAVMAAREQNVKKLKELYPELSESDIRGKLIGYSSDQSNSAIEKSGLLGAVPIKLLKSNENGCLSRETLENAIKNDLDDGKFPIICIANLGTTGTCAFDSIEDLGPICNKHNIWLHIDAAYAGAALCCPEYKHLLNGVEMVDSFNFNMHKWMKVNFDCSAMWLKNADLVVDSFNVERIYLKHQYEGTTKIPDYRHWQIPLGRKFRALKTWIVLRTYGAEKIRNDLRASIDFAKYFESLILNDKRFEIASKASMGLLSFRLRGDCQLTKDLLKKITERKLIYMIPATVQEKYVIRFAVCGMDPQKKDMDFAWNEIKNVTDEMFLTMMTNLTLNGEDNQLKSSEKFSKEINIGKISNEKIK